MKMTCLIAKIRDFVVSAGLTMLTFIAILLLPLLMLFGFVILLGAVLIWLGKQYYEYRQLARQSG